MKTEKMSSTDRAAMPSLCVGCGFNNERHRTICEWCKVNLGKEEIEGYQQTRQQLKRSGHSYEDTIRAETGSLLKSGSNCASLANSIDQANGMPTTEVGLSGGPLNGATNASQKFEVTKCFIARQKSACGDGACMKYGEQGTNQEESRHFAELELQSNVKVIIEIDVPVNLERVTIRLIRQGDPTS